ncbi:unnamed protein product, partial [Notodromas monacha]
DVQHNADYPPSSAFIWIRIRVGSGKSVSFSEEAPKRHLCKQVSIESPSQLNRKSLEESVITVDVPIPEVDPAGARVKKSHPLSRSFVRVFATVVGIPKSEGRPATTADLASLGSGKGLCFRGSRLKLHRAVVCAGVCYRRRDSQVRRTSSNDSGSCILGFREGALFPGFEVAGIVDALGPEVEDNPSVKVGDRVIVYPYDEVPHGYAEFISVPSLDYLVNIPDALPLPVASMLPTGALWALNAVFDAKSIVDDILASRNGMGKVKILMVGTGGLTLWALRMAQYYFKDASNMVEVTVATLKDEGVARVAEEYGNTFKVVTWSEHLHESALIERTLEVCEGTVDIVINFGTTTRILMRCMKCLNKGGTVMIGSESSDFLIGRFSRNCEDDKVTIKNVSVGSLKQLTDLVNLVVNKEIQPPPYRLYPADRAADVLKMVAQNEVQGRAILQFGDWETTE